MSSCSVGSRLWCPVCGGEFIVVKAPPASTMPTCGGAPLSTGVEPASDLAHDDPDETRPGKRYGNDDGLELLCTKAGTGRLALSGVPLAVRDAKLLPSSD